MQLFGRISPKFCVGWNSTLVRHVSKRSSKAQPVVLKTPSLEMLRTGPNPNLWFLFQNISYILAFVALGVGVLAEARLRAGDGATPRSWRRCAAACC